MNTKRILISFVVVAISLTHANAQKHFTRAGKVSFFSSTPIENIEAVSKEASSIIDIASGDVAFQLPIKSFLFENAKMQEHFNENYLESDKFPMSSFKGKIKDFNAATFAKDGTYTVTAEGDLTIHGVTKKLTAPGTITIKGGKISSTSKFKIKVADYDIRIPSVVTKKIAEEIEINVDCSYEPMKKS